MGARYGDMPVTSMGGFNRNGGGGNKIKTGMRGSGGYDGKRGDDPHGITGGYGPNGGYSSRKDSDYYSGYWMN